MPAFLNEPLTASFLFMISISTRPASNSHFLFSFPSVLLLFYFGGGGWTCWPVLSSPHSIVSLHLSASGARLRHPWDGALPALGHMVAGHPQSLAEPLLRERA